MLFKAQSRNYKMCKIKKEFNFYQKVKLFFICNQQFHQMAKTGIMLQFDT